MKKKTENNNTFEYLVQYMNRYMNLRNASKTIYVASTNVNWFVIVVLVVIVLRVSLEHVHVENQVCFILCLYFIIFDLKKSK